MLLMLSETALSRRADSNSTCLGSGLGRNPVPGHVSVRLCVERMEILIQQICQENDLHMHGAPRNNQTLET